jgi:hypothetical protein
MFAADDAGNRRRLTIDPPPLAIMAGIACLRPKNTPVALTAMLRCQASVL